MNSILAVSSTNVLRKKYKIYALMNRQLQMPILTKILRILKGSALKQSLDCVYVTIRLINGTFCRIYTINNDMTKHAADVAKI